MKSLWIYADADGNSCFKPLPLPFKRVTKPIDAEIFRRQARGEDAWRPPRLLSSTGLSAMRVVGERNDPWTTAEARHLVFVISGRVELTASDGSTCVLEPGDAYLEDDVSGKGHRVRWVGECRVLRLGGLEPWNPEGEALSATSALSSQASKGPLLRRMYKASDDKSYFRSFDYLFPEEPGKWSAVRPVIGFSFTHFPPDFFIDWHPEVVNNFVVVMTGELELEVGDGSVEVFGPGDVCLAEDRTGQGHIDRMHGENRIAVIVFEDQHLWAPQP